MKFLRTVGEALDWFVLRLILLLVVGVVGFAVLQPLIWSEILHKKPPTASYDLASLMTIVVTIIGLALAGFGVVVYQLAERKNEARFEKLGMDLEDKLRAEAGQVRDQLQADANNIRVQVAIGNAKNFINISVQAFLSYEDLWSKAQPPYSVAFLDNESLRTFLKDAIRNAKLALAQLEDLPPPLCEGEECARGILASKGNYLYFLATRGDPADGYLVIQLAKEMDRPGINKHKLETVAWAYLRYSKPGEELWDTGLSRLAALMKRPDLSPVDAKTLQDRYRGTFASNGILPAGLADALGLVPDPP